MSTKAILIFMISEMIKSTKSSKALKIPFRISSLASRTRKSSATSKYETYLVQVMNPLKWTPNYFTRATIQQPLILWPLQTSRHRIIWLHRRFLKITRRAQSTWWRSWKHLKKLTTTPITVKLRNPSDIQLMALPWALISRRSCKAQVPMKRYPIPDASFLTTKRTNLR